MTRFWLEARLMACAADAVGDGNNACTVNIQHQVRTIGEDGGSGKSAVKRAGK